MRHGRISQDYLYSDYMVAVLALFLYWNERGPSARQCDQIQKWFWATAVGSRYSGSNFNKCVPADLKFFKKLAERSRISFAFLPQADAIDVRKTQYASRSGISTAFYCMMLRRGPVSIMDDGLNPIPIDRYSTRANRKDRHHIFPRALLAQAGIASPL